MEPQHSGLSDRDRWRKCGWVGGWEMRRKEGWHAASNRREGGSEEERRQVGGRIGGRLAGSEKVTEAG